MTISFDKLLLTWSEALECGVEISGGKAWNLGRLERYGFQIPVGRVLSSKYYLDFLEENNLRKQINKISLEITLENIDKKETKEELKSIREKICNGQISPIVINELKRVFQDLVLENKPLVVRSSASTEDSLGASFAGIHDSFLNVYNLEKVLETIKACYASLWTVRAVTYRRKMNIDDDKVMLAVVIMEMIEAKSAGIAFSCDPHSGRSDEVIINANYGLGESVVSGRVEPDLYRLDSRSLIPSVKEIRIGKKEGMTINKELGGTMFVSSQFRNEDEYNNQVLSSKDIEKLGLLTLRVFDSLGENEQHQDIEWVFNGDEFFLVQARPVTILPKYTYPQLKIQPEIWSNGNIRDSLPMVQSTLNRRLVEKMAEAILGASFNSTGYSCLPGVQCLKFYQGRSYLNLSLLQWEFFVALGVLPKETNELMGGQQQEISIPENIKNNKYLRIKRQIRRIRLLLDLFKIRRKYNNFIAETKEFSLRCWEDNYKSYSSKEIIQILSKIYKEINTYGTKVALLNSSAGAPSIMLKSILEKYFKDKGNAIFNAILMGKGNITSAEQGYKLIELAEVAKKDVYAEKFFSSAFNLLLWKSSLPEESKFRRYFQNFMKEYGHRGVFECDNINPRWIEDPSYLLNIIKSIMNKVDSEQIRFQKKEVENKAWQEIKSKVPFYKRPLIRFWLSQVVKGFEMREMAKSELVRLGGCIRIIAQDVGRRLEERGILNQHEDVHHCSWSEINSILLGYWDGRGLSDLVVDRKQKREELEALEPPDLIIDKAPQYKYFCKKNSKEWLSGQGVASGRASGKAKLIRNPREDEKLKLGDVLVTPSTDPGWTPLFLKASAIVMETGGYLSHGAIVAREYGVPAVVNVSGVMSKIKDGQKLIVDGDEGNVLLIQ